MPQANPSFDKLASTTLKNYRKQLVDNISEHMPFFKMMREKGAVKLDGGESIVTPLVYEFGAGGSYSGSDTMDITVQDGISAAEYNWKQVYATATITGYQKASNMGRSRQINIVEATIKQAQMTIENQVATMLFGDGTGNSGKDILGLEAIVSQTPTVGVLGGIDASAETFWRNVVNTSVGSIATGGLAAVQTMIRQTQRGGDKVDLIIMDATNFGRFQALANNRVEIMHNVKAANLGIPMLTIEGTDVIFDHYCPADRIYGVNTNYLKLYVHEAVNFTTGDFIEPADKDIRVAKILLQAQLVTDRREAHFVGSGTSA
ncbi:MAG: phage major capsid protein [Steroidobacteraceae bacterium]